MKVLGMDRTRPGGEGNASQGGGVGGGVRSSQAGREPHTLEGMERWVTEGSRDGTLRG